MTPPDAIGAFSATLHVSHGGVVSSIMGCRGAFSATPVMGESCPVSWGSRVALSATPDLVEVVVGLGLESDLGVGL